MSLSANTMLILLIGALELALLLVVICLFLALQNRSLNKLAGKLRERMQALMAEIHTPAKAPTVPEPKPGKYDKNYQDFLGQQIKTTQARHLALGADQDIALDIDPETPLPRRVAALRYAILQAERAATLNGDPDWEAFEGKYRQILAWMEDYGSPAPAADPDQEEIELLNQELTNAKKRINNLEKFKALYFDLDERWQSSKDKVQQSFSALSQMAGQVDDSETYTKLLDDYQAAYRDLGQLLERDVELDENPGLKDAHGEIRHLRKVAAEQHGIINNLQKRLKESATDEEKAQIVGELHDELKTQTRYMQESETCIKLLEDELSNANKGLEQMRSRAGLVPNLKSELSEQKEKNAELDQIVYSLKSDKRRLEDKLEQLTNEPPADSSELPKYRKALADLQAKYADLEEKYLDIKMQQ